MGRDSLNILYIIIRVGPDIRQCRIYAGQILPDYLAMSSKVCRIIRPGIRHPAIKKISGPTLVIMQQFPYRFASFFNWTMSYRPDSDVYRPYGYIEPADQGRKLLSCSHCQSLGQQASWRLIDCIRVNINQLEARSAS